MAESTTNDLANFLVSHEKNDPSDPRFSQASAELRRMETDLKLSQDANRILTD